MAVTWEIKREVVNTETDLSKVTATRKDDVANTSYSFFAKGIVEKPEDQKKLMNVIWAKWLVVRARIESTDVVADTMKADLQARELA